MVSEVVREVFGLPLGCRRFFVGFVGRTSALLERSWSLLGRIWGGSEGSWGALWVVRSRLGFFLAALEPIFAVLARPWASLRRSWVALGRSWTALGCSWAALGRSWVILGPVSDTLGLLRASWLFLRRSRPLSTVQGGANWAPRCLRSDVDAKPRMFKKCWKTQGNDTHF